MRAEQTVSEMVVEVLARQADKLAYRSDQTFQEAFEEILKTEAGRQLAELAEGPHRHEEARYWQANLLFERVSEQAGHPVSRAAWVGASSELHSNPKGFLGSQC